MKPNEIHESIAQQVDHMRPAHLRPGKDIGMEVVDATTLRITVLFEPRRVVDVRYDRGPDTYTVTRYTIEGEHGTPTAPISDVYCDQLGELVFGDEAEQWTQPYGGVQIFDANGNVVSEETF